LSQGYVARSQLQILSKRGSGETLQE
jgi:hypothetical protein